MNCELVQQFTCYKFLNTLKSYGLFFHVVCVLRQIHHCVEGDGEILAVLHFVMSRWTSVGSGCFLHSFGNISNIMYLQDILMCLLSYHMEDYWVPQRQHTMVCLWWASHSLVTKEITWQTCRQRGWGSHWSTVTSQSKVCQRHSILCWISLGN